MGTRTKTVYVGSLMILRRIFRRSIDEKDERSKVGNQEDALGPRELLQGFRDRLIDKESCRYLPSCRFSVGNWRGETANIWILVHSLEV